VKTKLIMDPISAPTREDLLTTLRKTDISVPLQTEGRQKFHRERWSVCRWLSTFAQTPHCAYPLKVTHRDKPDFLIEMPGNEIGAECTDAIQKDYRHVLSIVERQDDDTGIDRTLFKWGQTKSQDEKYAIAAQKKPRGPGWEGDFPEKEWAQAMTDRVNKKTTDLRAKEFVKYMENILLVYDDLRLPKERQELAAGYFTSKLTDYWSSGLVYDSIFVETGKVIFEFHSSGLQKMHVNDLWTGI
jgi:hypothetical protein